MGRFSALFLLLCVIGCASWGQVENSRTLIAVDLGWLAVAQQDHGWLVTAAPEDPNLQRTLKRGDLITDIDGQRVADFGPLALAAMLEDVPFRTVPMTIERSGDTKHVQVFGEGVSTDGTKKDAPSYSHDKLQKRGEAAAQFSLADMSGHRHALDMYRGEWLLLNVWGTWCAGCRDEIPALNYLAEKHGGGLTVLGMAMNDTLETLKKFTEKQKLSYTVLIGGDFDSEFSRRYNLHIAPTNIVISSTGQIIFVGVGAKSLKRAVQTIAGGSPI